MEASSTRSSDSWLRFCFGGRTGILVRAPHRRSDTTCNIVAATTALTILEARVRILLQPCCATSTSVATRPDDRRRDRSLGVAALGRARRVLRGGRGGDGPAGSRRSASSGVVQGDHLFLPGPPPGRPGRADGGRQPHGADDRRRALRPARRRDARRERRLQSSASAAAPVREPRDDPRREARLRGTRRRLVAARVRGAGAARCRRIAERLERLAETARLARALFDEGWAHAARLHVVAVDLPARPRAPEPPRLLLGGGSKAMLELAGRYADHIDLAPPPRPGANQFQRPLLTTHRRPRRVGAHSPRGRSATADRLAPAERARRLRRRLGRVKRKQPSARGSG